jgi:glycosyltransferase involved in cell wall biosynthesis
MSQLLSVGANPGGAAAPVLARKEMTPLISVVIPTYNRAGLVGRAVASALCQLDPGDELIVIDDGSTDGTEEALAPYRGRIRYVRTPNQGAGEARNLASSSPATLW